MKQRKYAEAAPHKPHILPAGVRLSPRLLAFACPSPALEPGGTRISLLTTRSKLPKISYERLHIAKIPITNKYLEGKMKRAFTRE
jgi:hypothetical protein